MRPLDINISLADIDMSNYNTTANVTTLKGESTGDQNSFDNPYVVAPVGSTIAVAEEFTFTAPKYSVNIIRIPCTGK